MFPVIQSAFFLLFCATTGLGALLSHRLWVREVQPTVFDRLLAILTATMSVGLSTMVYWMKQGTYSPDHIDPSVAAVVAAVTGIGVVFVCLKIVVPEEEASE